jgi:hypothetical protein
MLETEEKEQTQKSVPPPDAGQSEEDNSAEVKIPIYTVTQTIEESKQADRALGESMPLMTVHIHGYKTCNFFREAVYHAKLVEKKGLIKLEVKGYVERSVYFRWLKEESSKLIPCGVDHDTSPLVWKDSGGKKSNNCEYIGGANEFLVFLKDDFGIGPGGAKVIKNCGFTYKTLGKRDKGRLIISGFIFLVTCAFGAYLLINPTADKQMRWALFPGLYVAFVVAGQVLVL